MRRYRNLALMCLVLAVAVPACKKASETTAEKAAERAIEKATGNKADVNITGGGIKVTGKEGGKEFSYEISAKEGAALPKNFPEDVPVYPGATVMTSLAQGDGSGMVTLQTKDPVAQVYDYYAAKFQAGGWQIAGEVTTPEMRMVSGKKTGREANVTVVSGDRGLTTISLTFSSGKG
jgi:hypothetical protein